MPGAEVVAMRQPLAGLANVRFCARHRCEWGTWAIVRATLAAVELALAAVPEIGHVYLASGACLPLRPAPCGRPDRLSRRAARDRRLRIRYRRRGPLGDGRA
ncbi:hypothetical protein BV509_00725 [Rhodovulum sulfidophilum]|nr:hypothetical protein BV509_00725 [Rhodovulum sulfidophilum]